MGQTLNFNARLYVGVIVALGGISAAWLLLRADYSQFEPWQVAVFGSLTLFAPLASTRFQGNLPSATVYQVASAFAYPLFLLGSPETSILVFGCYVLADWAVNRRRWLHTVFNLGQISLAAVIATLVVRGMALQLAPDALSEPLVVFSALLPILVFVLTNHILTHGIVCLSARRRILPLNWYSRTGFITEALMVVTGVSAAVLWLVDKSLVWLAILPVATLPLLLSRLVEREARLDRRETELQSLQGLGLKIGAELDRARLCPAVLQVVEGAFETQACLLAFYDPAEEMLRIESWRGLNWEPPSSVSPAGFDLTQSDGEAMIFDNLSCLSRQFPGLTFLQGNGAMVVPLGRARGRGMLILLHDDTRRPFDESDRLRLENLVPFIDVALDNSTLVGELKTMHDHLVQHEKLSALGMLVAGVAHELNNPLTTVLGYAEMLQERGAQPDNRERARRIGVETKRAAKIVQNLLTFSRNHKPERRRVSLHAILDDVLEFRAYEMSINNVVVLRDFATDLPDIDADPHQLHQVFLNLVANAEHSISKSDSTFGQIVIRTRMRNRRVRIEITDNGRGIRPENLKQVFLPFFTTKEVGEGTGLGLSICYGIVESHSGHISVESRYGEGATFILDLPRSQVSTRPLPAPAPLPSVREGFLEMGSGRLLVIDDEESIVHLVSDYLVPQGWSVTAAREGRQALELVDREKFDVLLVDVRMPGMDGPAFYEALKRQHPDLARRVVFATGHSGFGDVRRVLAQPGSRLLQKPYDLRELTGVISEVMRSSESPDRRN